MTPGQKVRIKTNSQDPFLVNKVGVVLDPSELDMDPSLLNKDVYVRVDDYGVVLLSPTEFVSLKKK